jgi:hypothetical protein
MARGRAAAQRWVAILAAALLEAAPARAEAPDRARQCARAYVNAQRLHNEGKLLESRRDLIQCGSKQCPEMLRPDCMRWLGEVDASIPSVVVSASAGARELTNVRVFVDGRLEQKRLDGTAIEADPGEHLLRFESPGHEPVERRWLARVGRKNETLEADLGDHDQSLLPVYVLGGVSAASFGTFAAFAISSHAQKQDLDSCKGHCSPERVDSIRRQQIVADVSLGVGIAALAATAYFYFSAQSGTKRERASAGARWYAGGEASASAGRFWFGASF